MLIAITSFAVAQTNVTPVDATTPEKVGGPNMKFETMEVDYGTIEQGADPYRVFKFTNVGTEPLVIKSAKGSCGCTIPTYPKEPILPGQTNEIKVKYDTNRPGPFTKRVTLTTNVSEDPVVLTIKGVVNKKAEEQEGLPLNKSGLFNNNGN
ncbi:MAG: DUF1573 domain-containing protein [Lewinella sp.]|nr:DUF1573 domain-containing protein [Lewinella sp.]